MRRAYLRLSRLLPLWLMLPLLGVLAVPQPGCQSDDGEVVTYVDDTIDGFIARKLRILAIDPAEGPLDGGQLVAMTGTGFQPDMTVTFGSAPAEKLVVGGDELAVMRTPAALEPGAVDVTVTLKDGRTVSVVKAYTYLPRPITEVDLLVLGVTPNQGLITGGNMVVVEGKGFIEGATVSFDGVPATDVRFLGETALTAIVPPGTSPGLVDVTVATPQIGGRAAAQDNLLNAYSYLPETDVPDDDLLVLGVLPSDGPLSGGNLVTIRGQGFQPGARVYIGGTLATESEVLGTAAISCRVPVGRAPGRVDVRVENLPSEGRVGQAHSLVGGYEYLDDRTPLQVLRVLPGSGPMSGGNLVAIEGTAFEANAQVYFGGAPASEVQLLADNVLSARVPAGLSPGRVNVRVELRTANGPGDSATLPMGYEYLDDSVSPDALLVLGAFPNSGPLGGANLVTLEGQGFAPGAKVYFEGRLATDVRVLGATAITCKAPAGAAAGMADLRVELPSGDAHTLADGYEYIDTTVDDSLLVLAAIPAEGPMSGGQVVALSGQGFKPGAVVYFGGTPATQVTVLGSTAITCRSPRGAQAGFVDVRVELPAAAGAPAAAHTLVKGYQYFDDTIPPDQLLVLGVIPSSGPLSGGNAVTVAGQGFATGAVVYFGGQAATAIQVLGPNAITAKPPAGLTPGFVDVRVQLPGGTAHSLPNAYQYLDDREPPVELLVLGAIPNTGPLSGGNNVTISGQGFAPGASVYFGGTQATEVTVLGPTAITCKAPKGTALGLTGIRVELANGAAHSLANAYTYYDDSVASTPLVVFSTIPASGPQAGGNVVAVAGQGFANGAVVYFGGNAATEVQVLGSSAITCKAPAAATVGAVAVRVELPDGRVYTLPGGYTYIAAEGPRELKVTAVTPAQGSVAGGTIVAVSGDAFVTGAVVYFGGVAGSQVQVLGPTALTAKVPPAAAAGLVDVRVQLPAGGVATLENGFEYYDDTEPPEPLLVLSVIPTRGSLDGGEIVTIAGSGFEPDAVVYFDGIACTEVQVLASSAITCRTPAGIEPGYVDVTVENADGAQRSLYNGYQYLDIGVSAEELLVLKAIPDVGPLSGGNIVAISGRGFMPGMKVWFGGAPATDVEIFGSTAVVCRAPKGTLPAGPVDLRVELPTIGGVPGDAYVLEDAYDYYDDSVQPDDLLVLAAIPVSGPLSGGNVVTIAGQGFVTGAKVFFGGAPATQVTVLAPEAITCVAPTGAAVGSVDVRVELPGAGADADTLFDGYTYVDDSVEEAPFLVIKTIPNSGPVTGGNVVAIEGSGFTEGAKVFFGGAPATDVEVLGDTAITCRAPISALPGLVTVRVELPPADGAQAGPAYNLENGYRYTPVDEELLRLATVYPIQGKVEGGELVLLTGTGFTPAMQVRFGGTASPLVQVLSSNSATALTPAHTAGLVDVSIVAPDSTTVLLPQGFSYVSDVVVDPTLGPRLGAVIPSRGPAGGGTYVKIIGENFAAGMKARFGGTLAGAVTVLSPTLATARVPAGPIGVGSVEVENPNTLKDMLASGWTWTAAPTNPPTLTSVWPAQGPSTGGTWVAIEGTNLADQSTVWFGMKPATATWYIGPTKLLAEAPAGAVGSVDLAVVRPDGATVVRTQGFAYYSAQNLPAPPPVVGDVFPRVGSIDGGAEVSVIGSNFAPDAKIYFGRVEAAVVRAIDGSIRVVTTPANAAGSTSVTVVNPDGLTHSKANAFVYYAPPPLIRQVTPNRGSTAGGTIVSVTGKNFRPDSVVRLGAISVSSFIAATPIELRFFAPPANAGKVDVRVDNADGQYDLAPAAYEYIDENQLGSPVITALEPNRGPAVGGYIALVRGSNFVAGANVVFGSTDALEVEWLDATVLKVKVPPGMVNTTVAVTVENTPSLTATKTAAFTYESEILEALAIRKVSPGIGPTTGGSVLTIEGAGFTSDSIVTIGTTSSDRVTFISPSTITAVTPPGLPGLVNVAVTRPDLSQAVSYNAFAYQRPETLGQGPRITSIAPVIGPMTGNALVLIEGSQFAGPAQVYFGANKAPTVTVLDSGRITVRTPATTVSGPVAVAVINADGLVGVSPGGYSYYDASGVPLPEVFLAQPNQGTTFGGDTVRILGDLFQSGAQGFFCDRPALVKSLASDDTLEVVTPPNDPGACRITVVNPDGLTADRNNAYAYVAPAPVVTTITPSAGPIQGGIDVVIQGDNFVSGCTVKFGNAVSSQAIVVDSRTIAARLPANTAGTVDVTVVNPGAQQATGAKANAFTYLEVVSGESPLITQVLPARGPTTGGTPVRILGDYFAAGALVILNGASVGNAVVSSKNEIRFTAPPSATTGGVPLTVLNPDGLGVTLATGFTYEIPVGNPPSITTIVPASGPEGGNTTITITGANFSAAGSWSLGGVPLNSAATISAGLVTAKTPQHGPGKVDLLYVGADGRVALKVDAFEYVAAPKLTTVTPALGGVAGGTEVTLVGDYFSPGLKVFFGANQGEVLQVTSTSTARARTPPSLSRGFFDVKVRNTDGQEGKLVKGFEYLDPVDVTAVWPPQGPNTGGTLVQIRGTGMHPQSRVYFGQNEATDVYYESYNLILAFTPLPTTSNVVDVRVANPDGREDVLPGAFTYKQESALGPKPNIDRFFPPAGPTTGGTRVALDGTNFDALGQAIFLPRPATTIAARNNRVFVTTPSHALGAAPLYWVNPDGWTVRAPNDFVYLDPADVGPTPSIREISPTQGPTVGGTLVEVRGVEFQSGAKTYFGMNDGLEVSNAATEIKTRTPAASKGSVEVWVVNPDGSQALSPDSFLYLPKPDIVTVSPSQGPASGNTEVTISGRDFMADPLGRKPDVLFCTSYDEVTGTSTECSVADSAKVTAQASGAQLIVKTPPHAPVTTQVIVVTPDGQRDVAYNAFRYTEVPTLTSVIPDRGPAAGGAEVTITGTGFQFGAYVLFDGVACKSVNVRSATEIICLTPPNAFGLADVTVGNLDGGYSTAVEVYTYVPAPLPEAVTPNLAPEDGDVVATITGKYFYRTVDKKPVVKFGTAVVPEADVTFLSTSALQVVVPAGQGAVDVYITNPDGQTGILIDGFAYIPPLPGPKISYVVATAGFTTGNEPFRIAGADFSGAARAFMGKPDADGDGTANEIGQDWIEISDTEVRQNGTLILGSTPSYNAGVVDVMVMNSDGQTAVKQNAYTYNLPPELQPLSIINIEPKRSVIQGGQYATIGGTGFRAGITVRFGIGPGSNFSDEVTVLGPTLIRVRIPPAPNLVAGKVTVRVTNRLRPGDTALEQYDAVDVFEYVNGPVFIQHPGDRLPNEEINARGSLVFDANADGFNDVLVFRDNNEDYLLINEGGCADGTLNCGNGVNRAGWFQWRSFANAGGNNYYDTDFAIAADINGDNLVDVVRLSSQYSAIQWCRNTGGGVFATCVNIYGNSNCRAEEFAVADFNNDSKLDIVMPFNTQSSNCRTALLVGTGNGGFLGYTSILPAETELTRAISVGDVDGDGDIDMLLGHDANQPTRLYLNSWSNTQASGTCLAKIPDFTNKVFAGNGKNYAYSNYTTNWDAARRHCQAYGYDLMTVDSQAEGDHIRRDAVYPRGDTWLGYYDPIRGDNIEANQSIFGVVGVPPVDRCGGTPSHPTHECWYYNTDATNTYANSCIYDYPCSYNFYFACEQPDNKLVCDSPWTFVNAQYGAGKNFPNISGNVYDVLLVDIDDDDDLDAIVAVNQSAQQTKVFLNDGTGKFADDDGQRWPQNEQVRHVNMFPVDIDFDGDIDVISRLSGNFVRTYINQLYEPGVAARGVAGYANETPVRWPSNDGGDARTDVTGLQVGDLDGDDLPDVYIVGRSRADRMIMNNGFAEGLPWWNENRVGVGKFAFNTYRAVPERYYNANSGILLDFDNDGAIDIAKCGYNEFITLWKNDGNAKFVDVTGTALPALGYRCTINGMRAEDMNEDGWMDIVVEGYYDGNTCPTNIPSCHGRAYLVNNKNNTFRNVAGTNMPYGLTYYGNGILFLDADKDGDNDWITGHGSGYDGRFFVNGGDVFNVGAPFGFEKTSEWLGGVGTRDNIVDFAVVNLNNDTFPDIYVSRSGQNRVWMNEDGLRYRDVTVSYSNSVSDTTRTTLVWDFNKDGAQDLLVINSGQNRYHLQSPVDKKYTDVTATSLPAVSDDSYSGDVGDLDRDGYVDFYVFNYNQRNRMYQNLGDGTFQDLTANLPWDRHLTTEGFLYDFDGDCDLDVYTVNAGPDQDRIYINTLDYGCDSPAPLP